jgi:hypothetical protein
MTDTATYLPLPEVERRTGLPRRTLMRRLAAGTVPVYIDGRDHRRRLIAERDLPTLTQLRRLERRAEEVAAPLPA